MGKPNPFAGGRDDNDATDETVDRLKRGAREAEERDDAPDDDEETPEQEEFVVGGEQDEEPDDDEDERPSRKERRRQRGEDLVRAERERREAAEARAEHTQRMLAETLNRIAPPPQQRVDPERQRLEQEAEGLRQQQEALTERYHQLQVSKKLTPEEDQRIRQESWKLRDRIAENDIRRFAPRPQQGGMNEQQVIAAANKARLMQEHPDIVGNQQASALFRANWMKRLARREPDDWGTLDKAMDETRREMGWAPKGGRPAPSARQKHKYTGMSRGGSGGDDGRITVKMGKEEKALADAAYSHIKDPKKRYQHYANRVGAKTAGKRA